MKLFSELRSCFYGGGATVAPAAETGLSSGSNTKQRNERGRTNCGGGSSHAGEAEGLRKVKSANTSRNWKPKLHAISEDSVVMSYDSSRAARSNDNFSAKVKPKIPSSTHGDNYWKSTHLWAIPAFSPTPFSF